MLRVRGSPHPGLGLVVALAVCLGSPGCGLERGGLPTPPGFDAAAGRDGNGDGRANGDGGSPGDAGGDGAATGDGGPGPERPVAACPALDKESTGPAAGTDRDLDGVGNDADVCPDDPDKAQADRDRDRLGDACDPFPDQANCVLFEDEFTGKAKADWVVDHGDWRASGWSYDQASGDALGFDTWIGPRDFGDLFVEARLHYTAPGTGDNTDPQLDVTFRVQSVKDADNRFYACSIDWAASKLRLLAFSGGTMPDVLGERDISAPAPAREFRLRGYASGSHLGCELVDKELHATASGTDDRFGKGSIGLRVFNATGGFDYVRAFALDRGTPLPF